MAMMMSNLPWDLEEEILSRVPLTALKLVRSTCTKWNLLFKDERFADKHLVNAAGTRKNEFLMIIAGKGTFDLISINLHGLGRNINLSITREGKLHSLHDSDPIPRTTSCNGLLILLCSSSIMVWNPYWKKTRWIHHKNNYSIFQSFVFGYDRSCRSHKILRVFDNNLEMYDLSSSNSWRVLNATLDEHIEYYNSSVSVKGNIYCLASDNEEQAYFFLLCFDFTREIFGSRLRLPFDCNNELSMSLSSVKEERLAVLFAGDIWITNMVESDVVSWSKFLTYDMRQLPKYLEFESFLIDEEKNAAMFFYQGDGSYKKAYLFGKGGSVMCTKRYPYTRDLAQLCALMFRVLCKPSKPRTWISPFACISLNKIIQ